MVQVQVESEVDAVPVLVPMLVLSVHERAVNLRVGILVTCGLVEVEVD